MKKIFVFSIFLILISFSISTTKIANAATAPSVIYTYKSSLQDISCTGNNCVAVGNNVILRSTNKGVTWKIVSSKKLSSPNDGSNLIDVDCMSTTCVAVGGGATMVKSSDGGKNWKIIDNFLIALNKDSFTSHLSGVDCINKNLCYAVGHNFHNGGDITKFEQAFGSVVMKSMDGGLTWNIERIEKAKAFSTSYTYSSLLPTSSPGMFEKTYTINEEPPLSAMQKIACKNEMECFGIGSSRSIFHTVDGWKTVTLQQFKIDDPVKVLTNGPNDLNSFAYIVEQNTVSIPQKVARYGFSGISFTLDGGVIIEDMGDGQNGGSHVILKSMDNGVTWQNINVPLSISSRNGGGQISCFGSVCVITAQNLPAKKVDILTSLDNGNTWTAKIFKKTASINGVVCVDMKGCFAVGDTIPKGVIIKVK
ncbi:MAG: hypothetical protein WDK96_02180 [Candidatus Paceibacterota bacterium]|jgi:photosystem II stability/assembly factor-like uncharacterized protein